VILQGTKQESPLVRLWAAMLDGALVFWSVFFAGFGLGFGLRDGVGGLGPVQSFGLLLLFRQTLSRIHLA
jgi:hypothetical protein